MLRRFGTFALCILAAVVAGEHAEDYYASETIPLYRCAFNQRYSMQPSARNGLLQNHNQQASRSSFQNQNQCPPTSQNIAVTQQLAMELAKAQALNQQMMAEKDATQRTNNAVLHGGPTPTSSSQKQNAASQNVASTQQLATALANNQALSQQMMAEKDATQRTNNAVLLGTPQPKSSQKQNTASQNVAGSQQLAMALDNTQTLNQEMMGEKDITQRTNNAVLLGSPTPASSSQKQKAGSQNVAGSQQLAMPRANVQDLNQQPMGGQEDITQRSNNNVLLGSPRLISHLLQGGFGRGFPAKGFGFHGGYPSPYHGGYHGGFHGGYHGGYPSSINHHHFPSHYVPSRPFMTKKFGHPFARTYSTAEPETGPATASIPAPPCPNNYLFSCHPVVTPVACKS